MDRFTEAYIYAALWDSQLENGKFYDSKYKLNDVLPDSLALQVRDCEKFQEKAGIKRLVSLDQLHGDYEFAGRDFWFARNGTKKPFVWDKFSGASNISKLAGEFGSVKLAEVGGLVMFLPWI